METLPSRTFWGGNAEAGAGAMLVACRLAVYTRLRRVLWELERARAIGRDAGHRERRLCLPIRCTGAARRGTTLSDEQSRPH
jgi:hypothetical protein